MISIDIGPLRLFERIRLWAGKRASSGNPVWISLADGLYCRFCVGVWVALLLSLLVAFPSKWGDLLLIFLGIAGGMDALGRREYE
jgi:hypothetical protein